MFVVTYARAVVVTMTMPCSDAPHAPDGDGILMDTAAATDDRLFATDCRESTDEQAHADDAPATGADADDQNPEAEDPTDKDGDANGTARILPSKEGSSKHVRTSKMTDKEELYHRKFSATVKRKYADMPMDISEIESNTEIAECFTKLLTDVTELLTEHPDGPGGGKGGFCGRLKWAKDNLYSVCQRKDVCRCCMTSKAKQVERDKSCEFCTTAWRLCLVTPSWNEIVCAVGRKQDS